MCSGSGFWHLQPSPRLGLAKVMVSDGPHGLRKQEEGSDHLGLGEAVPATCFPAGVSMASSWDPELCRQMACCLARECRAQGVSVVLGPAVNLKRNPLCGRNFEYYSEDPHLASECAAAFVEGVQSLGVGASIKHFAANNQEYQRMRVDTYVDERTLHELYLPAFERAVRRSQPWTVMAAYNRLLGSPCSESSRLMDAVLREEWGFRGAVLTDWGGTTDRTHAGARTPAWWLSRRLRLAPPHSKPPHAGALSRGQASRRWRPAPTSRCLAAAATTTVSSWRRCAPACSTSASSNERRRGPSLSASPAPPPRPKTPPKMPPWRLAARPPPMAQRAPPKPAAAATAPAVGAAAALSPHVSRRRPRLDWQRSSPPTTRLRAALRRRAPCCFGIACRPKRPRASCRWWRLSSRRSPSSEALRRRRASRGRAARASTRTPSTPRLTPSRHSCARKPPLPQPTASRRRQRAARRPRSATRRGTRRAGARSMASPTSTTPPSPRPPPPPPPRTSPSSLSASRQLTRPRGWTVATCECRPRWTAW